MHHPRAEVHGVYPAASVVACLMQTRARQLRIQTRVYCVPVGNTIQAEILVLTGTVHSPGGGAMMYYCARLLG